MDSLLSFLPIIGILSVSGIIAGFLAGLLGVGGGIIFVPVLTFVFGTIMHLDPSVAIMMATATSLVTMIPTTMSSCISHYKKGNLDTNLLKRWFIFLMTGVILGRVFAGLFGGLWLTILFGFIMLCAATNMMFFAKAKGIFNNLPSMPGQAIMAFLISSISVMLGIGGGTLTVPTLSLFNVDTKKAVGTASTVGMLVAVPGAITTIITDLSSGYTVTNAPILTVGHTNFLAALCIIPFSILMAPVGVKVNKMCQPHVIKRLFAILLVFTGLKMLMTGFGIELF
ncbi:MAG: sulfite exporter TauE/SafE family protein [Succinivibrionaceae bacterium]|nr:sulfite exporter TauE/SafE family protein [Succinivibrionaceae bacterium]